MPCSFADVQKLRGKNTGKGKWYPGPVTTDQQHLADHSVGNGDITQVMPLSAWNLAANGLK
jgi:hypothetical protein